MLVIRQRPLQLMVYIMKRIEEALGIRLEANITAVQRALELLVLREEGILAVRTKRITLQKERVCSIADNVVIRILTALCDDGFCHKTAIVVPEMKIRCNICRVADLLQRQDIRPERVDIPCICILKKLAERQACIEQKILLDLFRCVLHILRVIVVSEDVVRHRLDIKSRLLIRHRNPLGELDKVMRVHILFDQLRPALRAGKGQQRLIFVVGKNPIQILHDHGEARIIVTFLLRQHRMQCLRWLNRHLALNGTNTAHGSLSFS